MKLVRRCTDAHSVCAVDSKRDELAYLNGKNRVASSLKGESWRAWLGLQLAGGVPRTESLGRAMKAGEPPYFCKKTGDG